MQGNHVVYGSAALECGFVTVNIIRPFLADHLHIFIENAGVQYIVMVKKRDIIPRGHGQASVGVAGYTLVFGQFFIQDPAIETAAWPQILFILLHVFPADLLHISMLLIGTVRQTELPVLISLVQHRVQHFRQKLSRRII